jgi:hypothetical protein
MQPRHHSSIGRWKVCHGLIGLNLGEVLIFPDGIPFMHIPLQQFDLGDAFTDIGELELTWHNPTSPPCR